MGSSHTTSNSSHYVECAVLQQQQHCLLITAGQAGTCRQQYVTHVFLGTCCRVPHTLTTAIFAAACRSCAGLICWCPWRSSTMGQLSQVLSAKLPLAPLGVPPPAVLTMVSSSPDSKLCECRTVSARGACCHRFACCCGTARSSCCSVCVAVVEAIQRHTSHCDREGILRAWK